jgi:nucleotide-binding universal stress UspA family protein
MMAANGVIAATDGSEESLRAVQWAAREAVLRHDALRIVSVPTLLPRMSPDRAGRETVASVLEQDAARTLARATQRAAQTEPDLAVTTELLAGSPAQALLKATADASLLVVGSRGAGGFTAMILGSVSRYLATRAPCPVVVAREETQAAHREIVVGIRDPDQSAIALSFGFQEASLRNARLMAVHAWAWSLPSSESVGTLTPQERAIMDGSDIRAYAATRLESVLSTCHENYPGVEAGWEIVHAHPARVLIAASGRADLVVLGRHTAGSGIGSITHPVVSHAHGPVAIVPGE